jgi:GTP diphosphokinase / guanosine-3',5'-bis(diphosphate) 3'-diphosphatase
MSQALVQVMRALDFAARHHAHQRRKGAAKEPYINHLAEVATLLAEATEGRDPTLVIGGLLHDLIEDQDVAVDDIAARFGRAVADLVLEVTDDKSLSRAERKERQIETAAGKSKRARMLKLADKTSNLRSMATSPPVDWPAERRVEYVEWAKRVVAGCRGVNPALERAFDEAYRRVAPRRTA